MTAPKKKRKQIYLTQKNIAFVERMSKKLQACDSEIVRRALDKWEEEEK